MRQPPHKLGPGGNSPRVIPIPSPDNGVNVHPSPAPPIRPLKGRKRFTADLSELKAHPESVPHSGGWSVKSRFSLVYLCLSSNPLDSYH